MNDNIRTAAFGLVAVYVKGLKRHSRSGVAKEYIYTLNRALERTAAGLVAMYPYAIPDDVLEETVSILRMAVDVGPYADMPKSVQALKANIMDAIPELLAERLSDARFNAAIPDEV